MQVLMLKAEPSLGFLQPDQLSSAMKRVRINQRPSPTEHELHHRDCSWLHMEGCAALLISPQGSPRTLLCCALAVLQTLALPSKLHLSSIPEGSKTPHKVKESLTSPTHLLPDQHCPNCSLKTLYCVHLLKRFCKDKF